LQITLGLTPILPIILLVLYDFALWLWRHSVATNPKTLPLKHKLPTDATAAAAPARDILKPSTNEPGPSGLTGKENAG
jgi:hypothetical protein